MTSRAVTSLVRARSRRRSPVRQRRTSRSVNGVTDTELTVWGLGITQNVDAAASTLYLGYRNFSAD